MAAPFDLALGDVLREHARGRPNRTAVVCGDDRFGYAELDERVDRLATVLSERGVAAGDRVLWLGQNCHRLLEGLIAAARLGAMFCPANWRQSPEELSFVVDDLAPALVLWQDDEIGEAAGKARHAATHAAEWVQHDLDGPGGYEALLRAAARAPEREVDASTGVLVIYTAAFDGRPNGAVISHRAIVVQDLVMAMLQDIDAEHVFLNSGPLFHVGTFMSTLATFHMGGTNVFTRRADARELCRLIERERCTGAFLMTPTMQQMVEVNAGGQYDLSSLRTAPFGDEWDAMVTIDTSPWRSRPGGYGQTELMGLAAFNALSEPGTGASGRSSPALQLRVVDGEGRDVPQGDVGEIVARGLTVMNGYWNRPDLNARRRIDGWHRTSDLGRREADGSISFVGPAARMVKTAAENVYPAEVEACLKQHPAVADAAVLGVPDPTWGQNVKAVVVRRPGSPVTAEDLVEHCRARIASYKKPKLVEFADDLPRRHGVLDRDALDEQYGGGGYPGAG